jgi:hypothetical protein
MIGFSACAASDCVCGENARCPGLLIAICHHAKCGVDSRARAPPLCPGGIGSLVHPPPLWGWNLPLYHPSSTKSTLCRLPAPLAAWCTLGDDISCNTKYQPPDKTLDVVPIAGNLPADASYCQIVKASDNQTVILSTVSDSSTLTASRIPSLQGLASRVPPLQELGVPSGTVTLTDGSRKTCGP